MMEMADFFRMKGRSSSKTGRGKNPKPIRKLEEQELATLREKEQERINQEVIPKLQNDKSP